MTEPAKAVFLSYASQDAEAAQRIAEALRAAGIDVWLDQSELRGGDAWDESIRDQIKACALFIPVISANAHARVEGYFRLEWKLAVDRSHRMAPKQPFLLPVVIDDTRQSDDAIPDRFRELQWSRFPGGQATPAFVERVQRLLSSESDPPTAIPSPTNATSGATSAGREPSRASSWSKPALLAIVTVLGLVLAYLAANKFWSQRHITEAPLATASATSTAPTGFSPPPHSIAVLPFVNMSGDKAQEYFSEGLTEELLNSLSRINELQVAARTSSFSFQGEHPDISTVAHKLNVGAVLEGSVRRSAHTVRVTTQLINGITGFHVWSETYDRDLGDVLRLQTEIATSVASALKVTLLGDEAARIEIGGTRNPAAFDAYLRATNAWWSAQTENEIKAAIGVYDEAIRLDPQFAVAYADRSYAVIDFGLNWMKGAASRETLNRGGVDASKAISIAPNLAEGHSTFGFFKEVSLEFAVASQEFERALALAPGKAKVLMDYGIFAVNTGKFDRGLASERRAVMLDPLNAWYRVFLGMSLHVAGRYDEAIANLTKAKALAANDGALNEQANVWVGLSQFAKNDLSDASTTCEGVGASEVELKHLCLAVTYNKLGRHSEAEKMLGKYQTSAHTDGRRHVGEAMIYAQWGDTARALNSLEAAMKSPDPWLENVRAAPFLDPLRNEPRFQAIERALKFPE